MRLTVLFAALMASGLAVADEHPLDIETDLKMELFVVEKGGSPEQPILLLKRVRGGTTTYSKRLFDCGGNAYQEIAAGEILDVVKAAESDQELIPIREGSIADQLRKHACAQPPVAAEAEAAVAADR